MRNHVLREGDSREDMVRALAGKTVAVDVETVGLDPWQKSSRLRMVQLAAVPGEVWVDLCPGDAVRDVVRAAPALWGHNVGFDLTWLFKHGMVDDLGETMRRAYDTGILAFLRDNRPRVKRHRGEDDDDVDEFVAWEEDFDDAVGHALKDVAVHFLGPDADLAERRLYAERDLPPKSHKVAWEAAWAALEDDDPLLIDYAATDVDLVLRLRRRLAPANPEVFEVERRGAALATVMSARGFLIDTEQVEVARAWAKAEESVVWPLLNGVGITHIGATGRGYQQLLGVLQDMDAPLTAKTKGGALSLNRTVLEGLTRAGYEPADWVHRARRARRFQTDYLRKMLDNRGEDGRLRPSINTVAARTGRWSIGGALPMQQMPRTGGFRECFAAEPGKVLVGGDYSSIEFHTLGRLTSDEAMQAVTWSGEDPYVATAEALWPGVEVTREVRNAAKPFNLGLGYGMGPAKLAMMTGRTLSEAKVLRDRLRRQWPGPSRAMDLIEREHRGGLTEIPTLFGRDLCIPTKNGVALGYVALNHANQGTARDLMCRDLITITDAGLDPWLTMHDEVICSVDEADADEALATLLDVMNHDEHAVLGIPIRADGGVHGDRWRKV